VSPPTFRQFFPPDARTAAAADRPVMRPKRVAQRRMTTSSSTNWGDERFPLKQHSPPDFSKSFGNRLAPQCHGPLQPHTRAQWIVVSRSLRRARWIDENAPLNLPPCSPGWMVEPVVGVANLGNHAGQHPAQPRREHRVEAQAMMRSPRMMAPGLAHQPPLPIVDLRAARIYLLRQPARNNRFSKQPRESSAKRAANFPRVMAMRLVRALAIPFHAGRWASCRRLRRTDIPASKLALTRSRRVTSSVMTDESNDPFSGQCHRKKSHAPGHYETGAIN